MINIILSIKKPITHAQLLICLLLFFNSFKIIAQNNNFDIKLNQSEIVSCKIKKVNPKNQSLQRELFLSPVQIADFVIKWNTSTLDSSEKVKPKYFLFIEMTNKSIKYFAIGGNQIDDGNGNCLSAKDNELFFEKLWKSLLE